MNHQQQYQQQQQKQQQPQVHHQYYSHPPPPHPLPQPQPQRMMMPPPPKPLGMGMGMTSTTANVNSGNVPMQTQMQPMKRRPPPPPPPVSSTAKYLITLPSHDNNDNDRYLSLQDRGVIMAPLLNMDMGACIQSINVDAPQLQAQEWVQRYGMKSGDVLYKIDGRLVKTMKFDDIMSLLNTGAINTNTNTSNRSTALMFERCSITSGNTRANGETTGEKRIVTPPPAPPVMAARVSAPAPLLLPVVASVPRKDQNENQEGVTSINYIQPPPRIDAVMPFANADLPRTHEGTSTIYDKLEVDLVQPDVDDESIVDEDGMDNSDSLSNASSSIHHTSNLSMSMETTDTGDNGTNLLSSIFSPQQSQLQLQFTQHSIERKRAQRKQMQMQMQQHKQSRRARTHNSTHSHVNDNLNLMAIPESGHESSYEEEVHVSVPVPVVGVAGAGAISGSSILAGMTSTEALGGAVARRNSTHISEVAASKSISSSSHLLDYSHDEDGVVENDHQHQHQHRLEEEEEYALPQNEPLAEVPETVYSYNFHDLHSNSHFNFDDDNDVHYKYRERVDGDDDIDDNEIEEEEDMHIHVVPPVHEMSQLASPTFSYSVTTNGGTDMDMQHRDHGNGNGHHPTTIIASGVGEGASVDDDGHCPLMSPLGANLSISMSLQETTAHAQPITTTTVSTPFDNQVNTLKEKYAPYLSPESEYQWRFDDEERLEQGKEYDPSTSDCNGPDRQHQRPRPTMVELPLPVSLRPLEDEEPIQHKRVPSMESCSVSTVFMSPLSTATASRTRTAAAHNQNYDRPQDSNFAEMNSYQRSGRRRTFNNSQTQSHLQSQSQSQSQSHQSVTASVAHSRASQFSSSAISYRDIPVAMLDYNYVRQCSSVSEMYQIVGALKSSSPVEFPSLLRLAEARLKELRKADADVDADVDSNADANVEVNVEVKANTITMDEINRNEVERQKYQGFGESGRADNVVGVPSHIHVKIPQRTRDESASDMNHASAREGARDKDGEDDEGEGDNDDINEIIVAHAELKGEMEDLLKNRNEIQSKLTWQVTNLEVQLKNTKSEMEKQTRESNSRIGKLTKEKNMAEHEMNELRNACVSSSTDTENMMVKLKQKEVEIGSLASQLYKERESKRAVVEDSNAVQTRLQEQVNNLSKLLELQTEKTEAIRSIVENEMILEFGAQAEEYRATIAELERKLNTVISDSQVLYEENQLIADEFSKVGLRFESRTQFHDALVEFAAGEACANALAKALTESESELSMIVQENKIFKNKAAKLVGENIRLGQKNTNLTLQISAFDEELKSSNALVDRLYKDLDKYKTKQKSYEKVIKKCKNAAELYKTKMAGLRSQLNQGETVPIAKYQTAMDSVQSLTRSLKVKENEVEKLSFRIRNLENMIEENRNDAASPKSSPSIFIESQDIGVHVKSPASKLTPRQAALRALGGRAALKEKMKKSRGVSTPLKGHDANRKALNPLQSNKASNNSSHFASVGGKENQFIL